MKYEDLPPAQQQQVDVLLGLSESEDLHEDLIDYLNEVGPFVALQHPLIYDVPYSPQSNKALNMQYIEKSKARDQAWDEDDWNAFVFIHERPYRLEAFGDCEYCLEDIEFWKLLRGIYVDSENIYQNMFHWRRFLNANRNNPEEFMDADEREFLASLPDVVTVYRGWAYESTKHSFSWTLEREIADKMGSRYGKDGHVVEITVQRKNIFAYTNARNEQEVIILDSASAKMSERDLS